jgi:hypothetical protein
MYTDRAWIDMDCARRWNVDDQYLAAKQPYGMPRQQTLDTQHPLITRGWRTRDMLFAYRRAA